MLDISIDLSPRGLMVATGTDAGQLRTSLDAVMTCGETSCVTHDCAWVFLNLLGWNII